MIFDLSTIQENMKINFKIFDFKTILENFVLLYLCIVFSQYYIIYTYNK